MEAKEQGLIGAFGVTGHDEQKVGKPVQIGHRARVHVFCRGQRRRRTLGAADDGAREVQMGRQRVAAPQNERRQRFQRLVDLIDLAFESGDLVGLNPQVAVGRIGAGPGDIRAQIEQIVLDPGQNIIERAAQRVQPGEPDGRIRLIHITDSTNPQ